MASDFLTDDVIVQYFSLLKPDFVLADIPSFIRSAAWQEIIQRTSTEWTVDSETIYVDGRGDKYLFIPEPPIVSISSMTIIGKDLTETSVTVDQTDDDRQVWWDAETGKIELINYVQGIEYGFDPEQDAGVFPKGEQNIKIVGVFGRNTPAYILQMLQLLCMVRHMMRVEPSTYGKGDMVMEKIGKYAYELYGKSTTRSERMSLDQYIDYLFGLLPQSSTFAYDAV